MRDGAQLSIVKHYAYLNWHYARKDRDRHAHALTFVNKVDEDGGIIEQLSDDHIRACVHLFFEVLHILGNVVHHVGMAFRVACNAYTEIVSILRTNVLYEINGIGKAPLYLLPLLTGRWIASKCENILYSSFVALSQSLFDKVDVHVRAC